MYIFFGEVSIYALCSHFEIGLCGVISWYEFV